MRAVTFGKFPRLTPGNDDSGAPIFDASGRKIGCIERRIDWLDRGGASATYRARTVGYEVVLFFEFSGVDGSPDERVFGTLAEARDAVRKFVSR